jgi:hypothetical protein
MSHYTEDELSAYALRPEAIDDREAVEQHVADCCDCRNTLDVIEAFDIALQDPMPWEMSRPRAGHAAGRFRDPLPRRAHRR